MEENQLALHCYFRSNCSQRGYRKRKMEIWQELSNFQTTSQRLTDQVWRIIKNGWFSDLKIFEIYQKINAQQITENTLPGTSNINKQNQPIRKEPLYSENENSTQLNSAQPNKPEQTQLQEQKLNLENLKRIMNSEKITLPSLRNIEMGIVRAETNKVNQVLTYISTNNITELNELINARAKLLCEKIGISSKRKKEKSKPGSEFRQETQRKQAKILKQKKDARTIRNRKGKTTLEKLTIKLKEINQKVLVKEGRLKRYWQRVK